MSNKYIQFRADPEMYDFLSLTAKRAGVRIPDIVRIAVMNLQKKNVEELPLFKMKE